MGKYIKITCHGPYVNGARDYYHKVDDDFDIESPENAKLLIEFEEEDVYDYAEASGPSLVENEGD